MVQACAASCTHRGREDIDSLRDRACRVPRSGLDQQIAVSERGAFRRLTQFLRRSVSVCPQTAECKSHRGTGRFEGRFCAKLFQAARKSLILKGEMSEWSIEHAWKACIRETVAAAALIPARRHVALKAGGHVRALGAPAQIEWSHQRVRNARVHRLAEREGRRLERRVRKGKHDHHTVVRPEQFGLAHIPRQSSSGGDPDAAPAAIQSTSAVLLVELIPQCDVSEIIACSLSIGGATRSAPIAAPCA